MTSQRTMPRSSAPAKAALSHCEGYASNQEGQQREILPREKPMRFRTIRPVVPGVRCSRSGRTRSVMKLRCDPSPNPAVQSADLDGGKHRIIGPPQADRGVGSA